MSSLSHHASSFYFQPQNLEDSQQVSQPFGTLILTPDVESPGLMYQRLAHHHSETEYSYAGPGKFPSSLGCPSGHPSSSYQGGSEHPTGLEYSSPPQDLHHAWPRFSPYPNTEFQPQPLIHNSTYSALAAHYRHNVAEVNSVRCDDQPYLYTRLSHGHSGTANSLCWVNFNPEQSMIGNIPPSNSDWVSYFPPTQSRLVNTGHFIQSTSEPDHHPQGIEQNHNIHGGSAQQHTESPRMIPVIEKPSMRHVKKRSKKQAHIQHEEQSSRGLIKSSLIECQGCLDGGSTCRELISYNTCKAHLKVHFPGPHKKKNKVKCLWCKKFQGWQNLGRHFQENHMKFRRIN